MGSGGGGGWLILKGPKKQVALRLTLAHAIPRVDFYSFKGSMYLYRRYLGLQGVPIQ